MVSYSLAQASGLSSLSLDLKRRSAIQSLYSQFICGNNTILWFVKSLTLKLHSSPGEIVKNNDGGSKEYHMENSFALPSFAVSSQYGRHLQAAVSMWMRLFVLLWLSTDESNLVFFEISKISDSEILDNLSLVEIHKHLTLTLMVTFFLKYIWLITRTI